MTVPVNLQYTSDHEWVAVADDHATVGITAFAADALGDVVYVDLPDVGTTIAAGETCGEVESTKSVSDLYAPVDGEIIEINPVLADDPGLINNDPFGEGWLFRVKVSAAPELLDAAAYDDLIANQ